MRFREWWRLGWTGLALALGENPAHAVAASPAGEDTLLILYTNDLHDHVRPDYDGSGGLPWVAGTIARERAGRTDVLVLDAGDVTEKGDLVAHRTGGLMTYEAMARIGYHAGAPGNHDYDFGLEGLRRFAAAAGGMQMVCVNLMDEAGQLLFAPSAVFVIDGLRVGVIGMLVPQAKYCLDEAATAEAMAQEAARLEGATDLLVAVCHYGVTDCVDLARAAPGIDVFISGHTHEVVEEPVLVEETGALIVQAGSYAEYTGRLELTVDVPGKRVSRWQGRLLPMEHGVAPVDAEMLAWVQAKEAELTPEASRPLGVCGRMLSAREIGFLGAEGLRRGSGAEVAFCHAGQVVRDTLPVGPFDVNALFRTGGQRGEKVVLTELTGGEIENYLRGLAARDWGQTQWAGMEVRQEGGGAGAIGSTNLDPERVYRVAMPLLEWETRFLRLVERVRKNPGEWPGIQPLARIPEIRRAETSFTDGVMGLLEEWAGKGMSLEEGLAQLPLSR